MKMCVPHRTSVDLRLRLCNGAVHCSRLPLYLLREIQAVDQIRNVPRRGVVVTVMLMVMIVMLLLILFLLVLCAAVSVFQAVTVFLLRFLAMYGICLIALFLRFMAVFFHLMTALHDMLCIVFMSGYRLHLFLSVHGHLHMRSRDPAGRTCLRFHPYAGEPESVHRIQKSLFILQQFIEGRHKHVPCRSHFTFYIKCPHLFTPPSDLPFD